MPDITPNRVCRAYETAKATLLAEMVSEPVSADDPVQKMIDAPVNELRHWVGQLSTSALATATAVMALEQMRRQFVSVGRDVPETWTRLIRGGIEWLIAHQNSDGGWGDTVKSISNISTTMLCHAVVHAVSEWSFLPLPLREGRGEGPVAVDSTRACNRDHAIPRTADVSSASNLDRIPHPAFGHPLPEGEGTSSRVLTAAQFYIDRAGGVQAVIARYGKDRTFSVPILTHCALAGLVDWNEVISLPFELACIPATFYAAVRLPVVSYALPALIAIGQVRFHFRPSRSPLRRWLQRWAKPASLKVLERIQPPNGGFLEATPLTSFVTMSLAAMGLIDHPVTRRGIEFIMASARWDRRTGGVSPLVDSESNTDSTRWLTPPVRLDDDISISCSWPIDTNLATWVTTLSINALGDDVPLDARPGLRAWLLRQQNRVVHPYTNAAPGGWAWTDHPGGVPDADDTPGAMLALMQLTDADGMARLRQPGETPLASKVRRKHPWLAKATWFSSECLIEDFGQYDCICGASGWLSDLQNSDGGWPTFCRGWGTLPFDRSSPDITAHVIRALSSLLSSWKRQIELRPPNLLARSTAHGVFKEVSLDVAGGLKFLKKAQRPDGSWLPLWFGNQHAPNDENPTYGTAKVLAAFQALGRMSDESAVRGVRWLVENQNPDGGWGAGLGTPSSVEETALALETLLGSPESRVQSPAQGQEAENHSSRLSTLDSRLSAGLSWLISRVDDGRFREPAPIGFYFAKLWYFEALYPLIFTVAALRRAVELWEREP